MRPPSSLASPSLLSTAGGPSRFRFRVWVNPNRPEPKTENHDGRRHDDPAGSVGKEFGCRSATRDDRLLGPAPDGVGGAGPDRRRAWRADAGADQPPQRLPRPALGDAGRHGRSEGPEAAQGQLLPCLLGTPADGGEGTHGGDPGGLHPGGIDPLGRRAGSGHGHERHLEEPGLPALRGDRRQDQELPRPPARGRLALPLAGCDLREGARGRAHRPGRGNRGRRGQRPGPARGARHGDRRV